MTMRYSRYLLWLAIAATLGILAPRVAAMYTKGALLNEWPFVVLSTAIICSPYLFMLRRARKIAPRRASRIYYATCSLVISVGGTGVLYWLIYVAGNGQGAIAVVALVLLQWLFVVSFLVVDSLLQSRDRSQGA